MPTWYEFAQASPDLAALGERMLRIGSDKPAGSLAGGLAYLATIRKDGGPRIHPISPALIDGRLYAFILHPSPKQRDLLRDGRYALHSWPYPMDEQHYNDDEFYLSGTAAWIDNPAVDVVISTGGTGVTGRDVTPEAFESIFEKKIDGFGELFRWISYQKIKTSTIQSRAVGGVAGGTYLFALPGSPGACRDGWEDILKWQLDSRFRPCNLVELMPRLQEHLTAGG